MKEYITQTTANIKNVDVFMGKIENDYIKQLNNLFRERVFIEFLSKYYYSYKIDTIKHHEGFNTFKVIEVVLENKYNEKEISCVFHPFRVFLEECPIAKDDMNFIWVSYVYSKLKSVDKDIAETYKNDYKKYIKAFTDNLNSLPELLN